jgi:hypothetical protein
MRTLKNFIAECISGGIGVALLVYVNVVLMSYLAVQRGTARLGYIGY